MSASISSLIPALWQDLRPRDPDTLQEDLTSLRDDFSDCDGSLGGPGAFPASELRWVSASRIHRLLKYEPSTEILEDEDLARCHERWAEIAQDSGECPGATVWVCNRIEAGVIQGSVGNFWLVAALAPLAEIQRPIRDIFAQCPRRPYEGRDGPYTLCLFDPSRGFRKTPVVLNDRVPCFAQYGNRRDRAAGWRPCFATGLYREMWPMLLEKGLAKILGGYHRLNGNRAPLAWAILTGETHYGALFPWPVDSAWDSGKPKRCGTSHAHTWGEGEFDLTSFDLTGRNRSQYKYQPRCKNERSAEWVWDRLRFIVMDGRLVVCTFQDLAGEAGAEQDDRCDDAGHEIGRAHV